MNLAKEKRFVSEQKTLRKKRRRMREMKGKGGLGTVEELWVTKARSGEEERDS